MSNVRFHKSSEQFGVAKSANLNFPGENFQCQFQMITNTVTKFKKTFSKFKFALFVTTNHFSSIYLISFRYFLDISTILFYFFF